ncbi:MAG: ImmA/IrrE family metallo-endopeptidase [Eubacterium sp.]|nr:ImmA/IrrE family metallo-endopeptidase [Eubacterium sp.]
MELRNYGRYKNIRNASWQALIDFNISQLPVSLKNVASQANIKIIPNSSCNILNDNQIGLSLSIDDEWYIIYDDTCTKERSRFTIAHELGHIFLGHSLTDSGMFRTVGTINKPEEEQEADMFAIRFLAPACVLKGLDLHTAKKIADACCISMQAAQYRANRMKILYERNKFFLSPLERQVYRNFEEYIKRKK